MLHSAFSFNLLHETNMLSISDSDSENSNALCIYSATSKTNRTSPTTRTAVVVADTVIDSDAKPIRNNKKRKVDIIANNSTNENDDPTSMKHPELSEGEIHILERVIELTPQAVDHMREFHRICSCYDQDQIASYINECCSYDCRLSIISVTSSALFPEDHVYWEIRGRKSIISFLSTYFMNVPDGSSRCNNVRISNYIKSDASYVVTSELTFFGTKTYETEVCDSLNSSWKEDSYHQRSNHSKQPWSSKDGFILGSNILPSMSLDSCGSMIASTTNHAMPSIPCNSFSNDDLNDEEVGYRNENRNDHDDIEFATKATIVKKSTIETLTTLVLEDLSSYKSSEQAVFKRGHIVRPPTPFELFGKLELLIDRESTVRGIKFCFI